jgi:hypothetical protein
VHALNTVAYSTADMRSADDRFDHLAAELRIGDQSTSGALNCALFGLLLARIIEWRFVAAR